MCSSDLPILEAPDPEAGREIPPEAHGEAGPSPQRRDRPTIPCMAQPPAPRTNPGLPDKLIVSSQTISDRLIAILILLIFLILMTMMLSIGMLGSNYDSGGESLGMIFFVITLFILLFSPIVAYFVWLIRKE